jgi:predicted Zn finger-like uncharacterized protein
MSSVNNCPHCGQQVRIPDEMLGRLVRCPLCGQAFTAGGNEIAGSAYSVQSVEPHRGGLVLTLGILGLVLCGFLGPVAWYMGAEDLDKMRRGVMDKSGYGVTQAGLSSVSLPLSSLLLVVFSASCGLSWLVSLLVEDWDTKSAGYTHQ